MPGVKILAGNGTHERQLHVRVRVDATRHDILPASIDDLRAVRRVKIFTNGDVILPSSHRHIGAERAIRVDYSAAL